MTHPATVEIATQAIGAHVSELRDAYLSLGVARRLIAQTPDRTDVGVAELLDEHISYAQNTVAAAVLAFDQLGQDLGRAAAALTALEEIAAVTVAELDSGLVESADLVRRAIEGLGYLGAAS